MDKTYIMDDGKLILDARSKKEKMALLRLELRQLRSIIQSRPKESPEGSPVRDLMLRRIEAVLRATE